MTNICTEQVTAVYKRAEGQDVSYFIKFIFGQTTSSLKQRPFSCAF